MRPNRAKAQLLFGERQELITSEDSKTADTQRLIENMLHDALSPTFTSVHWNPFPDRGIQQRHMHTRDKSALAAMRTLKVDDGFEHSTMTLARLHPSPAAKVSGRVALDI